MATWASTSTGAPTATWGAWETTGIVDASGRSAPDVFLINVQAHTLWIEKAPGVDTFIDTATVSPTSHTSAKAGSCCLIRIPGG